MNTCGKFARKEALGCVTAQPGFFLKPRRITLLQEQAEQLPSNDTLAEKPGGWVRLEVPLEDGFVARKQNVLT